MVLPLSVNLPSTYTFLRGRSVGPSELSAVSEMVAVFSCRCVEVAVVEVSMTGDWDSLFVFTDFAACVTDGAVQSCNNGASVTTDSSTVSG
jgi:hypothetical protein